MNTNEFQAEIDILFKDDRVLKEALTHRSYLNAVSYTHLTLPTILRV